MSFYVSSLKHKGKCVNEIMCIYSYEYEGLDTNLPAYGRTQNQYP